MRTPLLKYRQQRNSAKFRGIGWDLTFESWWAIWQASGHWARRGNCGGHYVMARFGDTGPYAAWNVKIIPHEENISEGKRTDRALPIGVSRNGKRFQARRWHGEYHYLGTFDTPEQAHAAYLMAAPQAQVAA